MLTNKNEQLINQLANSSIVANIV